jgi:hypothetical protein
MILYRIGMRVQSLRVEGPLLFPICLAVLKSEDVKKLTAEVYSDLVTTSSTV